nr:unnamed protein product [Digitaria exilis]
MGSWWSAAVGGDDDDDEVLERLERPLPPPLKMKLGTYAMYRVFTGPAGDKLGCAYVGLHFALYLARVLSLEPVPGRDLVWGPVHFVLQCICYTATTLVACIFIRSYMNVDGVYAEEFDPQVAAPPPSAAAAEEHQLPLPPPEMDMC